MVTFIEIMDGPNEGSRFKVEEGLTLGRSKADIIIKDGKVSSTHAQFALDGKGQFVLQDLDSSNGIHINGRRVKKVALLPGVIFELGRTQFKVVTVEEELALDFSRLITWRSILRDRLGDIAAPENPPKVSLQSFSPALRLVFVQGIQTDEEIILGYGPRSAGADSLDIELLDEEAPQDAFELHPGPGMVEIKIKAKGRVTLNHKTIDAEMLKDGDLISVGNTLIKVNYV
ncbi:FHA domain-containing protein [Bdellovibrio bacteriovorus]|uniref:FHA domain-containing protein n=1 Tax=Bdellovibrio bacteriovorus TaxID=959 RepID=UPI0021D089D4|nr:FHA domain-containing protein [Bdellovibrio bacteriovorus]UXR65711.1 FHA domain-containing protein [Bdellovibrio bacteriovorus]